MFVTKSLKSYKNMEIEKSYELNTNGTIKNDTIIYTAYPIEENGEVGAGVFDADKTLVGLKKKIDGYVKQS